MATLKNPLEPQDQPDWMTQPLPQDPQAPPQQPQAPTPPPLPKLGVEIPVPNAGPTRPRPGQAGMQTADVEDPQNPGPPPNFPPPEPPPIPPQPPPPAPPGSTPHQPPVQTVGGSSENAPPQPPGPVGAPLSGFDATKWADPNYHSTKYDIGHILAKYPSTPAGLQQAKAEIEKTGLGHVTGKDIVTLNDGTIVDVGMGFSEGGGPNNWWWGVQSGPGGQVAPTANPGFTPTAITSSGFPSPLSGGNGFLAGEPNPNSHLGGSSGSVIDDTLLKIMQGGLQSSTGQAGRTALENFLKTGGDTNARLESIREKMSSLMRSQMSDARGDLASRGLLSEGSMAQGPEMSTLGRVEANLTPQWTAAARDAVTAGDANLIAAATTATGLDQQQIALMLSGANSASQREQMLATLAAKSLDQNMAWNEFLANYGLNRDQIMYAIQHGQVTSILPLIKNFFDGSANASSGAT